MARWRGLKKNDLVRWLSIWHQSSPFSWLAKKNADYRPRQRGYGKQSVVFPPRLRVKWNKFQQVDAMKRGEPFRKRAAVFLASSKLSDYQINKIVHAYAHGQPASQTARLMTVSFVTVRSIYTLLRRRLIELRVYKLQDDYEAFMEADENEGGPYWDRSDYDEFLRSELRKRKGVTDATRADHIAELTYRFSNIHRFEPEILGDRHYIEILKVIALSGPINRPLSDEGYLRAWVFRANAALNIALLDTRAILDEFKKMHDANRREERRPKYRWQKPRYGK